jgi:hypothetical protein
MSVGPRKNLAPSSVGDSSDNIPGVGCTRGNRMGSEIQQSDKAWLRSGISELWCCRLSFCRSALGVLARSLPTSFYEWCIDGVDHGKIWSEETTRNPGSLDACSKSVERRINEEIGLKILGAIAPMAFVVICMFGMFFGLLNLQKINAYANVPKSIEVAPKPVNTSTSGVGLVSFDSTARNW